MYVNLTLANIGHKSRTIITTEMC